MMKSRLVGGLAIACGAVMVSAGGASAAPKTGCPARATTSQMSVEDAAARMWPGILNKTPWIDEDDFRETSIRPYDRNGDGDICLSITQGEELNPNAHWYRLGVELIGSPAELYNYTDNNRGAVDP